MKKTVKLFVLCSVLGIISAQADAVTKDKIRFGVKGGVNASTTAVSLSAYDPDHYVRNVTGYKYNAGFNAGVFVECPLSGTFSLQPELILSTKGMRSETFASQYRPSITGFKLLELHAVSEITSYYIELPLYVKAGFDLSRSGRFIAGIGVYFACGINGKIHSEYVDYELSESGEPSNRGNLWSGEKDIFKEGRINFEGNMPGTPSGMESRIREPYLRKPLKRFDGGLSGFIGYELRRRWFITASCDMGLVNMLNPAEAWDGEVKGSMYNRTFSISSGYKF
jgi:hypothetical protein